MHTGSLVASVLLAGWPMLWIELNGFTLTFLLVFSISCLDEMVCTDSNDNQLSKIIFSSNIFSPFDIARDQSANTYYPNMVCTMSLTAPSGYEAYIEFSPCALDSPGSCDDEAIVTQANSASQKYCGTGNPGIYTWMNTLEATVKTDSNGQAVGCGGYILTACKAFRDIGDGVFSLPFSALYGIIFSSKTF